VSEPALLADDETDLIGQWVNKGRKLVGDVTAQRIEWLIGQHLILLGKAASGWDELYRDPLSGKLWERSWPQSAMHGGGPPRLTLIAAEDALGKYGAPAGG